ncbi:MAG: hypothetical protein H8E59_12190 [Actinobacteria bacterium]|nr:hypothetical protein [Actinomycetota bacterium]
MQRVKRLLAVFIVWTVVVWGGRVRNIVADDALTAADRSWRLLVAAVFLTFAALSIVVMAGWWRQRRVGSTRLIAVFCIWTAAFWGVRWFGMVFGDHDLDFKLVHSALALVSIVLALRLHRLDRDATRSRAPHSSGGNVPGYHS